MMQLLQSIRELVPTEFGGRNARQGFTYQDHIGASYCIDMLMNKSIEELWFENLDDITILYDTDGETIVEFVQVKASNLQSRWSVATLTSKDKGMSILEKSLNQCRCREKVKIRFVTSYDVNSELEILKHQLNAPFRITNAQKLNELEKSISNKLGTGLLSPNGMTLNDWLSSCLWDKQPDSIHALESLNKTKLDQHLIHTKQSLLPEYRNDLYDEILSKIKYASTEDIIINPYCYIITKKEFEEWVNDFLIQYSYRQKGKNPLDEKMLAVGFEEDDIASAKELKFKYLEDKYNPEYYEKKDLELMEKTILAKVHSLKMERYTSLLSISGIEFHNTCLSALDEVLSSENLITKYLPDYLAKGFFYNMADRCLVKFKRS